MALKNQKTQNALDDFMVYIIDHPTERFWQALRNWSGADFIVFVRGMAECDTFEWVGKDEFQKTYDGQ